MSLNYPLLVEVDDVGLLAVPFYLKAPTPALYDRVWLSRDSVGRGRVLNRYTGQVEYLTEPTDFGDGEFGNGIFGWS